MAVFTIHPETGQGSRSAVASATRSARDCNSLGWNRRLQRMHLAQRRRKYGTKPWTIVLFAIVVVLPTACEKTAAQWHTETGYRWRELSVVKGTPGFTRLDAGATGITFANSVSDSALRGNRVLGQGAGVALGDVDGDGLPDVFLARTEGCSALAIRPVRRLRMSTAMAISILCCFQRRGPMPSL